MFESIEWLPIIPSTNDYLSERLSQGLRPGAVCIADGQTKGRGRLGKNWASPPGANIYLSFYWQLPRSHPNLSALTLVIGLAVLEGLKKLHPFPETVGLKWPNDLWHGDAKWGGILIEQFSRGAKTDPMVDLIIGIGINVTNPTALPVQCEHTDLSTIWGEAPERSVLIAVLLKQLAIFLPLFETAGLQPFLPYWDGFDRLKNRMVTFTAPEGVQTGRARGISPQGALCVEKGDTRFEVHSGEVHTLSV